MNLNLLTDRLSKIPRAQRMVSYVGFYVLVTLAYGAVLYLPGSAKLQGLADNHAELVEQKSLVEARVKHKDRYEDEQVELEAQLKEAVRALPNQREMDGLLKGTSALAKKVGLEVRKFRPLPELRREYVAEVPVELEVAGGYHDVAMFFDRLSKSDRIVYVRDIEMNTPVENSGKVNLAVSGNVVTFRFLSDDEIAEAAAADTTKKKGSRRRRRSK